VKEGFHHDLNAKATDELRGPTFPCGSNICSYYPWFWLVCKRENPEGDYLDQKVFISLPRCSNLKSGIVDAAGRSLLIIYTATKVYNQVRSYSTLASVELATLSQNTLSATQTRNLYSKELHLLRLLLVDFSPDII